MGMPKYDWLKITEMHVLAAAAFVIADMLVSWKLLLKVSLKVNVHRKRGNCNRIPSLPVYRKEILVSKIVL